MQGMNAAEIKYQHDSHRSCLHHTELCSSAATCWIYLLQMGQRNHKSHKALL